MNGPQHYPWIVFIFQTASAGLWNSVLPVKLLFSWFEIYLDFFRPQFGSWHLPRVCFVVNGGAKAGPLIRKAGCRFVLWLHGSVGVTKWNILTVYLNSPGTRNIIQSSNQLSQCIEPSKLSYFTLMLKVTWSDIPDIKGKVHPKMNILSSFTHRSKPVWLPLYLGHIPCSKFYHIMKMNKNCECLAPKMTKSTIKVS